MSGSPTGFGRAKSSCEHFGKSTEVLQVGLLATNQAVDLSGG